jgi:hypothetical protein
MFQRNKFGISCLAYSSTINMEVTRSSKMCSANNMVLRMVSSGMLHHVALVRTYVSEELSASIIRVTRQGLFLCSLRCLLVTANVPNSPILVTLMMEALSSSKTSVLTRATWCNIPEDAILHSHRRENLKSYNIVIQHISLQGH